MSNRQKIAVIGGGMSALSTIYNITQRENRRDKYDITIYQMGWRIGGKGASGRNMEVGARIEEHGLHIWFGFYNNAFNLIKKVYREYTATGDNHSPFKSWHEAFKPQSYIPLFEHYNKEWTHWGLDFPTNNAEPGGMEELLPFHEYIQEALKWIWKALEGSDFSKTTSSQEKPGCLGAILGLAAKETEKVAEHFLASHGIQILEEAMAIIEKHEHKIGDSKHPAHTELKGVLDRFSHWQKKIVAHYLFTHDPTLRHLFIVIDLTITSIRGILADHIFENGLDSINNIEYMDWLRSHGAAEATINSTLITALYDVGFAYINGDLSQRSYEAGSALRIIFRLGLTYHGAFMWKMQAGMGDTIFTPIYKVFSQYEPTEELGGITFKFFHKMTNLELSADKTSIAKIHFDVQAAVKDGQPYDPLVIVNDIPCWPNQPLYEQLVDGEALRPYNLESHWTAWTGVPMTLEAGRDYDLVLLGTPIATLPYLCSELIAAAPSWQTMLEKVQTTQTQAYQLWLTPTLAQMGWTEPSPISTSYVEPVDTWADMAQLIIREDWPEGTTVGDIAYFCGVLQDAKEIPPPSVHSFPATQKLRVFDSLKNYTDNNIAPLWPDATDPTNPNGLNYDLLVDQNNGIGEQRLNTQFWRANIDPSERYTLTNVGSSAYRLDTDQTDTFTNLYIVGDWIQNNFNYGCIECCAMSGILAARAITGVAIPISGEKEIFLMPEEEN